jgi:hypothetical protein
MVNVSSTRRAQRGLAALGLAAAALLLVGCSTTAPTGTGADPRTVSQGFIANAPGACTDPWINSAFNEIFTRAPQGSGDTGECNIDLYGGGSWGSYADLYMKVWFSKICADPWIAQAVWDTRQLAIPNHVPRAAGWCNTELYGWGTWNSYANLKSKVLAANLRDFQVDGSLVAPSGRVFPVNQVVLVNTQNNQAVAADGGNFIGTGSGTLQNAAVTVPVAPNIIAAGGGNIVAAGGGN